MKKYSSKEIRKIWIDFFVSKNHQIIESKSLIPENDNSILWINSGVATLKDYFSGRKTIKNPRITNSQKCIRTNDIENVGQTSRHHTFFEMLGNFSIGDYFKNEALEIAYELIFDKFKFKKEKIYISYYEKDQKTYQKWISLGIDKKHLIKGTKKTNFWDLGQGPCGPCTEIFYDRGKKYDLKNEGISLLKNDIENERYIEIWNIVFSEFNNDGKNNYEELIQKNIDTGAGLERMACIFQDVPTNFDTDLFMPIIKEIEKLSNQKYVVNNYFVKNIEQTKINKKIKIIADHIRAIVLTIQDGAKPSNTKRGYIIRRLIRRAYRNGIQLGIKEKTFLSNLIPSVNLALQVYKIDKKKVQTIIEKEELIFSKTIKKGEKILLEEINKNNINFDPNIAFKLFETYGFPIELTKEILAEKNINLNMEKYYKLLKEHSKKSKTKKLNVMKKQLKIIQLVNKKISHFIGYENNSSISNLLHQVKDENKYYVILDKTPFYATKGGQLHDWGTLNNIEVQNVFRDKYENHWHVLKSKLTEKKVNAKVNKNLRIKKNRNHSSTHLLGLALTKVYSKNTLQLGSYNDENKLRLDFNHDKKPTSKEIEKIEKIVNKLIKKSIVRKYKLMKYKDAIEYGVLSLELENYGDGFLRVVEFDESKEFCGGTHIENTSLIEKFKIIKIDSKGSGVFRIEAITSNKEIENYEKNEKIILIKKIKQKIIKNKKLNSTYSIKIPNNLNELKKLLIQINIDNKKLNINSKNNFDFDDQKICIKMWNNMPTYINLNISNFQQIKKLAINLREKFTNTLIIIGSKKNGKLNLIVTSNKYKSKEIFDKISSHFNGKGGGNNKIAMGLIDQIDSLKDVKWE